METISGKIYKIFSPKENEVGTIFKYCFSLKTHNNYITCYGESFELFEDETVVLEGNRKKSGNTGKEYFQFELCKVDFETIQLESNFLKKIFGKRYSTLKISFSNVEILTMLKNNERNKIAICLGLKPDSKRLAKYFEKFEALKSTYTAFETLEKYGRFSAGDLVDLTHREDTPWSISGKGQFKDKIISNDVIKKFHCNEEI